MKLILASNSKTRKDIFDMVGWKYEVITSSVVESSNSIDPKQYVIDLSKDKANSVASQITDKALIISADSIIYMDNKKFEKPKSKEEGFENIKKMSGRVNYAVTGVTIKDLYQNKEISFTDITEVYFKNVSEKDIAWYVENEKYAVFNPASSYLANSATYADIGKTLDEIITQARTQYVCGEIDEAGLQTAWDNWLNQGGQTIIDEVNAQYEANK